MQPTSVCKCCDIEIRASAYLVKIIVSVFTPMCSPVHVKSQNQINKRMRKKFYSPCAQFGFVSMSLTSICKRNVNNQCLTHMTSQRLIRNLRSITKSLKHWESNHSLNRILFEDGWISYLPRVRHRRRERRRWEHVLCIHIHFLRLWTICSQLLKIFLNCFRLRIRRLNTSAACSCRRWRTYIVQVLDINTKHKHII